MVWGRNKTTAVEEVNPFETRATANPAIPGNAGAADEFERAAAATEAAQHAAESIPVDAVPEERLQVSEAWARTAVRYVFYPLEKYDHPSWALTDAEAAPVVPKMQAALQVIADRYVPSLLAGVINKHPEISSLALALAVVWWQKRAIVREAKIAEFERAQREVAARSAQPSRSESPVTLDVAAFPQPNTEAQPA